jgi:hypothetical protein
MKRPLAWAAESPSQTGPRLAPADGDGERARPEDLGPPLPPLPQRRNARGWSHPPGGPFDDHKLEISQAHATTPAVAVDAALFARGQNMQYNNEKKYLCCVHRPDRCETRSRFRLREWIDKVQILAAISKVAPEAEFAWQFGCSCGAA